MRFKAAIHVGFGLLERGERTGDNYPLTHWELEARIVRARQGRVKAGEEMVPTKLEGIFDLDEASGKLTLVEVDGRILVAKGELK